MSTMELYADMPAEESGPEPLKVTGLWLEGQMRLAQGKALYAAVLFKKAYRLERFLAEQAAHPIESLEHLLNALRALLDARDVMTASAVESNLEKSSLWDVLPGDEAGDLRPNFDRMREGLQQHLTVLGRLWAPVRPEVQGGRWERFPQESLARAIQAFPGYAVFHWAAFRRAQAEGDMAGADKALEVAWELDPDEPKYVAMRIAIAPKLASSGDLRSRAKELYARARASSAVSYMYAGALVAAAGEGEEGRAELLREASIRAREALELKPSELSPRMQQIARLLIDYCQWKLADPGALRRVETEAMLLTLPSPEDPHFEREMLLEAASGF